MSVLPEHSPPQAVQRHSDARHSSRAAKWLVGLAAVALAAVSVAGYCYRRIEMAAIAAEHVRLMVIGPSRLQSGAPAQFDISTRQVTAAPVSMPVEVDVYSPDGKRLLQYKESTDRQGRLQVRIPADMSLPANATLKVTAITGGGRDEMSAPLPVDPLRLATQLSLDKPLYQPGETLFYRSLTLRHYELDAQRDVPIRFEILDPGGAPVPNSRGEGVTERGVGNGAFSIPDSLPGGPYTLCARSPDGSFPEAKIRFLIRRYRMPRLKKELVFARDRYAPGDWVQADFSAVRADGKPAAGDRLHIVAAVDGETVLDKNVQAGSSGGYRIEFKLPEKMSRGDGQLAVTIDQSGTRETIAKAIPISAGALDVQFFPEGGNLVAGLENRVYFVCRDALGKPVTASGLVVTGDDRLVAEFQTSYEGMGQFSFSPRLDETYRLKIIAPADIKDEPKLPAPKTDCPIVLTTGTGVFGPSEPLEFNIRSSKGDLPLVVGAWCRGVLVGQAALVAGKNQNGMNPVVLPLPDDLGGVIRLTVFDYSVTLGKAKPQLPKPLAERLVYRRSSRRLNIRAHATGERYRPGDEVKLTLSVTNEKHQPVAAVLGVSVIDKALLGLGDDRVPSMPTRFLLTSAIKSPEDLENADFYLSDDKSSPVSPALALDLLLGTQGWRQIGQMEAAQAKAANSQHGSADRAAAFAGPSDPPTLYDNLSRIQADYQQRLAAYHSDSTQVLDTIITVCFLAALGLLVLVFMLGLFRIVRGGSLWLPVLATTVCCAVIGALTMTPRRLAAENQRAVPFLLYNVSASETGQSMEDKGAGAPAATQSSRRAESPALPAPGAAFEQVIARQAAPRSEKALPGPAAQAKTEHFVVRQYAHQHVAGQSGAKGDFADSLFWNPLLIAGPDGKASVSFDLPDSPAVFRLSADAHGDARLGAMGLEISTQAQKPGDEK